MSPKSFCEAAKSYFFIKTFILDNFPCRPFEFTDGKLNLCLINLNVNSSQEFIEGFKLTCNVSSQEQVSALKLEKVANDIVSILPTKLEIIPIKTTFQEIYLIPSDNITHFQNYSRSIFKNVEDLYTYTLGLSKDSSSDIVLDRELTINVSFNFIEAIEKIFLKNFVYEGLNYTVISISDEQSSVKIINLNTFSNEFIEGFELKGKQIDAFKQVFLKTFNYRKIGGDFSPCVYEFIHQGETLYIARVDEIKRLKALSQRQIEINSSQDFSQSNSQNNVSSLKEEMQKHKNETYSKQEIDEGKKIFWNILSETLGVIGLASLGLTIGSAMFTGPAIPAWLTAMLTARFTGRLLRIYFNLSEEDRKKCRAFLRFMGLFI